MKFVVLSSLLKGYKSPEMWLSILVRVVSRDSNKRSAFFVRVKQSIILDSLTIRTKASFEIFGTIGTRTRLYILHIQKPFIWYRLTTTFMIFNTLNAQLNPTCYLLALLRAHHFLHVSRIMVKSLILRLLMLYIYGAPILDVSRSHTTTHHSR